MEWQKGGGSIGENKVSASYKPHLQLTSLQFAIPPGTCLPIGWLVLLLLKTHSLQDVDFTMFFNTQEAACGRKGKKTHIN